MLAALETAASLDASDPRVLPLQDPRPEPDRLVLLRHELQRIDLLARRLTPEQRLVIATQVGLAIVIAGLRLDTSHNGTDVGPNRAEDGPRWRILDHIPTWARWSVRHPPGL
jgi:hypothetical protein